MNAICTWWMLTVPEGRGGGALWASAPVEKNTAQDHQAQDEAGPPFQTRSDER
jgi:hypothetical protein